jgi:membrane protease YdiL (CAAX protease family)
VLFYGIACGFTWLAWTPLVLVPAGLKLHKHAVSLPISACIGTLGPFFACFISHRVQVGNWRAVRLMPQSRLQMVWLLLGPLLVLFGLFFVFPAFISKGDPRAWHWHVGALVGLWVPMFNYNLLGGPLFEEFGWRGFLQPRLQRVLPPWIAAISVGIMWAAWHLPLFLVGWSSASPLAFMFICGWSLRGNGVCLQCLRQGSRGCHPDAFSVQRLTKVYFGLSGKCTHSRISLFRVSARLFLPPVSCRSSDFHARPPLR